MTFFLEFADASGPCCCLFLLSRLFMERLPAGCMTIKAVVQSYPGAIAGGGLSGSATSGGAAGLWLSGGEVLHPKALEGLLEVEEHLRVLLEEWFPWPRVVPSRTVLE